MPTEASPPAPYLRDSSEVVLQFNSSVAAGLSESDARARLATVGANALVTTRPAPAWRHFLAQFQDPLVYLLLAAVTITLAAWALEGFNGWPLDALVILVIVCLNAVLGFVQETRSQRATAGPDALGLGLQVAVVELPWLNLAFGTVPLSLTQWGLCLAMGSVVLWCGELRKLSLRHGSGRRHTGVATA